MGINSFSVILFTDAFWLAIPLPSFLMSLSYCSGCPHWPNTSFWKQSPSLVIWLPLCLLCEQLCLADTFRGVFSLSFLVTWPIGVDSGLTGNSLSLAKGPRLQTLYLHVLVDLATDFLCDCVTFGKLVALKLAEFCLSNEKVQNQFLAPSGNTVRSCALCSLCWSEDLWLPVFVCSFPKVCSTIVLYFYVFVSCLGL